MDIPAFKSYLRIVAMFRNSILTKQNLNNLSKVNNMVTEVGKILDHQINGFFPDQEITDEKKIIYDVFFRLVQLYQVQIKEAYTVGDSGRVDVIASEVDVLLYHHGRSWYDTFIKPYLLPEAHKNIIAEARKLVKNKQSKTANC